MAANPYTTTFLLASIKRRGFIPSTAGSFSDSDILEIANEELQDYVMNVVLECHEEYLVTTYDVTVESGQASYSMPSRAVGGLLRTVSLSSNGGFVQLTRFEPQRADDYPSTGGPQGYVVEGNNIVLVPAPTSSSDTLRMKYFIRPNRLVTLDEVGVITSVSSGTGIVTISEAPATFVSGLRYDFVRGTPHFDSLAIDQVASVSGTSLTFDSLPDGLAVGDHVCLAGESAIPQVPVNIHAILAQRSAAKVLEGLGDDKANTAMQVCEQMRQRAMNLMKPRIQSAGRFIINRNGPGQTWTNWRRGR